MTGYVLIHRSLIGHPDFRGKDDEYAAMWLVARAAWEPCGVRVGGRYPASLDRGQCAYAVSYLAKAWECSKATAHARLRYFEKIGFIRTEVRTAFTIITVCKYSEYQAQPNASRTLDRTAPERCPNADRTNNKEENELKEDSLSSLRSERARAGANRGSRLSFESLPLDWEAWALQEGHPNPQAEWAKFTDYWRAKTGKDAVKADWFATWRNWVRRSLERVGHGKTAKADTGEREDRLAKLVARVQARTGSGVGDGPRADVDSVLPAVSG